MSPKLWKGVSRYKANEVNFSISFWVFDVVSEDLNLSVLDFSFRVPEIQSAWEKSEFKVNMNLGFESIVLLFA